MSDFISRIKTEKKELDIKIDKLVDFISTDNFNELNKDDQKVLLTQQAIMAKYSDILAFRLSKLKGK